MIIEKRVNQGNRNNGYYTKRGNYLMYQADENVMKL